MTSPGVLAVETLGEALRLLQSRAGINRDDMARLVGVSNGAISNYFNGVSAPSASVLRRIANVLGKQLKTNPAVLWIELGHLLDDRGVGYAAQGDRRRRHDHLVDEMHRSLTVGDMETFFDLHTEDVVVHVPGSNPLAGDHKGEQAARQVFTKLMELAGDSPRFEVHDILANEEHTVLLLGLRARRGEEYVHLNFDLVCHLRDGKVTEMWVNPEDQYRADAFWS